MGGNSIKIPSIISTLKITVAVIEIAIKVPGSYSACPSFSLLTLMSYWLSINFVSNIVKDFQNKSLNRVCISEYILADC